MRDDGDVDTITLSDIILHRNKQNKAAAVARLQITPGVPDVMAGIRPRTQTQKYFNYTNSGSFVILFKSQL